MDENRVPDLSLRIQRAMWKSGSVLWEAANATKHILVDQPTTSFFYSNGETFFGDRFFSREIVRAKRSQSYETIVTIMSDRKSAHISANFNQNRDILKCLSFVFLLTFAWPIIIDNSNNNNINKINVKWPWGHVLANRGSKRADLSDSWITLTAMHSEIECRLTRGFWRLNNTPWSFVRRIGLAASWPRTAR